jgi:hypothetical protein
VPRRPIACATGIPDPQAGVLQFSDVNYRVLEGGAAIENGEIMIARTNGSRGTVSANFAIGGGTAVSGRHYEPLSGTVLFADGETDPRIIGIETPQNGVAEANKTVTATLSSPGGCAVLGANTSATVTIVDDDSPPPPPPRFTVGGTVVGLIPPTGGNLVLENHTGFLLEITAAGPFTFTSLPSLAGTGYFVRVFNQPRNVLGFQTQLCTVGNGSGIFGNANVIDVLVTCVDF